MLGTTLHANNKHGDIKSDDKLKFIKPKTRILENQKLSKLQKLTKSKKPSKRGYSSNFSAKKTRPRFLTSGAKETFNCL